MKEKRYVVPRNPLVRASLFRKAGSHRKSNKALRAKEKAQLRKGSESFGAFFLCIAIP